MTLSDDELEDRLDTQIVSFYREDKEDYVVPRRNRVEEAISWVGGPSTYNPKRHVVDRLQGGYEVYFLKPGKETDNTEPNPHDMAPQVDDLYENYNFDQTWAEIVDIALTDFEMFEYFSILLYRCAFLLDNEEVDDGGLRYRPDKEVIQTIDSKVGHAVNGNIMTLLHFLDVLGWNEDVKYHGPHRDDYDWYDNFGTGRINTLLTGINIPYKVIQFIDDVDDVVSNAKSREEIDSMKILNIMQDLSNARGVAPCTQSELDEWFSPVLYS